MTGQHAPIPLARVKAQSSSPDYLFEAILVALVALPGLQLILLLQDELWRSMAAGSGEVALAATAGHCLRPSANRAQLLLGCAAALAPAIALAWVAVDPLVSVLTELASAILAWIQLKQLEARLEELEQGTDRDRHLGWRAPSPVRGRGLRLVYAALERSDVDTVMAPGDQEAGKTCE